METILLIEEDPRQRILYRTELEFAGYRVEVAATQREAVQKLDALSPNLVILDVRPPALEGLETLQWIKHRHEDLPVVIYSADATLQDNPRSWRADVFVLKSSNVSELKRSVRWMLQKREDSRRRMAWVRQLWLGVARPRQTGAGLVGTGPEVAA